MIATGFQKVFFVKSNSELIDMSILHTTGWVYPVNVVRCIL